VHAISSGADFAVRLWEVASGAEVRAFTGHKGLVNEIAVSADGKRLLSGSQYDGTARLWDIETGAELASIALAGRVSALAFLSDNEILVADGRHIKLWKPSGQLVRIYAGRGN
jgi:WD40 repeat protein